MPSRPSRLPEPYDGDEPFAVADALRAGAARNRLFLGDLDRPFAGVRTRRPPETVVERARAYAIRMQPAAFFSHTTAAVIHDMWLPNGFPRLSDPLDVSVFVPGRAPRDTTVRGHHLRPRGQRVGRVAGLPVLGAAETWCELAPTLTVDELVVAADGLLTPNASDPMGRLAALRRAAEVPGRPGGSKLRAALALVRVRVRSAQESRLRLLIVRSGRAEPVVNFAVCRADGRFVAEIDLAYPDRRLGLEYEGDHHRSDRRQFRKDILRRERLMDLDWWIIRLTQDDLEARPGELLARLDGTVARRDREKAQRNATLSGDRAA